jgi:hypothetical protein
MAIIVNGTTLPITKGTIKVGSTVIEKVDVVYNGTTTTVWTSSNPYHVSMYNGQFTKVTGDSSAYGTHELTGASPSSTYTYGYQYIAITKNAGSGVWQPSVTGTCTLSTQGCNKVKITYSTYGIGSATAVIKVNGVQQNVSKDYTSLSSSTVEFDCAGLTEVEIEIYVCSGSESSKSELRITDIYFCN